MKKDLISILDLSKEDIQKLLILIKEAKSGKLNNKLPDNTLALIFQKPSTRTRISFEVAMKKLGGNSIYLNTNELQLSRGETLQDTARTISRYANIIVMRTHSQNDISEFAKYSSVPVINGLSDIEHPTQVISDIFTTLERKCDGMNLDELKKLKIAYFGDFTNVLNSFVLASYIIGFKIFVSSPKQFKLNKKILNYIKNIEFQTNPFEAAKNADILYTDVWVSMGQKRNQKKIKLLKPYQLDMKKLKLAKKDALVMHCLPAVKGEEISEEVFESKNSIVFDQAENRLYTNQAILLYLLSSANKS